MTFTVRFNYVDPQLVVDRLCRNPNYGGRPCSVPGTCIVPFIERKIKPTFFVALRKDVVEKGFRNPVLLYSTPEGLLLSFGGSRLRVAKELDKWLPAIIVDYTGQFKDYEEVTLDNWETFFTDVPELFEWTDIGVETHYSLERNRREFYDPKGMAWTEGVDDTDFLSKEFPWLRK